MPTVFETWGAILADGFFFFGFLWWAMSLRRLASTAGKMRWIEQDGFYTNRATPV
jgi:hypothetical protein